MEKIKLKVFYSKEEINLISLNITRDENVIKQHSVLEYLGCLLDENMSGESMARLVLKKVNEKNKFLYR